MPRVWQGVEYRPLDDLAPARDLFEFAAAVWPPSADHAEALGAWADGSRLVGAVVIERRGVAALLYGPVVVRAEPEARRADESDNARSAVRAEPEARRADESDNARSADTTVGDQIEIAAQLVSAAVDHVTASGTGTVFARPQGLDRVWVRFGFIPVPEVALPEALRGRPGAGLFAYRGGSALWSWRESAREAEDHGPGPQLDLLESSLAAGSQEPRRRRSARNSS